jgi:ADP-ribose pyrophosphatase
MTEHDARLVDARQAGEIGERKPGQLGSRVLHDGRIVHLSLDTVRFPDGSTGEIELIRHSGAAAVIPILGDPDGDDPAIVLVRQFRYAAGGELFEVPAGRPDQPGEPWENVAARELEEETGYVHGDLRPLTTIYTTPGFTDERIHLFVATGLTEGRSNLDQDEFVEVVTMPLSAVLDAVRDGRIIDAKSIAAILYFASFRRGDAATAPEAGPPAG